MAGIGRPSTGFWITLFNDTLKGLLAGTVTEEEINRQFADYWWNPYLYQEETAFFACFYHPKKTIEVFNGTNCGYTILE